VERIERKEELVTKRKVKWLTETKEVQEKKVVLVEVEKQRPIRPAQTPLDREKVNQFCVERHHDAEMLQQIMNTFTVEDLDPALSFERNLAILVIANLEIQKADNKEGIRRIIRKPVREEKFETVKVSEERVIYETKVVTEPVPHYYDVVEKVVTENKVYDRKENSGVWFKKPYDVRKTEKAVRVLFKFLKFFIKDDLKKDEKAYFKNLKEVAKSLSTDAELSIDVSPISKLFRRAGYTITIGSKLRFLSLYKNLPAKKHRGKVTDKEHKLLKQEYIQENYIPVGTLVTEPKSVVEIQIACNNINKLLHEGRVEAATYRKQIIDSIESGYIPKSLPDVIKQSLNIYGTKLTLKRLYAFTGQYSVALSELNILKETRFAGSLQVTRDKGTVLDVSLSDEKVYDLLYNENLMTKKRLTEVKQSNHASNVEAEIKAMNRLGMDFQVL